MQMVSVLMPTYNVEKYVQEAVYSILNQTYTKFELIIVDDCSTDRTYEILLECQKKDSRIRLFRNDYNLKICKTLNKAYKESSGEYILRMDGDDICQENRIEILMDYMLKHEECDLIGSYINCIDEMGNIKSLKRFPVKYYNINKALDYQSCVLHIWLAKRNVYNQLKGYRELPYVEDYDFLLRGRKLGFKYHNIPQPLYSVRQREGNTASSNGLYQQKAKIYVRNLDKLGYKFKEADYYAQIQSSEKEINNYNRAYQYLQNAINNRNNKKVMLVDTIKAACSSKYIRLHLMEAIIVRIIIRKEKLGEKKWWIFN